MEHRNYLVKIDSDRFVVSIQDNLISTTTVPSVVDPLTYQEADAVVRRLRRQYRGAYITNTLGEPATAGMLRAEQMMDRTSEAPVPQSWDEYYAIPSTELKKRMREPAFAAAVNRILATPEPARKARQ
jgi:hypothetical protein